MDLRISATRKELGKQAAADIARAIHARQHTQSHVRIIFAAAPSQSYMLQALIQEALERSGVEASQIGYVEAHGTGTPLGDPIETRALGMVLAPHGPGPHPVYVGSVKTNIGHTEAAAGVAGLIKAALMLRYQTVPASLHFKTLNPHIDLAGVPI